MPPLALRPLALAGLAILLVAVPAVAQKPLRLLPQPDPPPTRVRPDVVALLHSSDPRQQVWGAWIAGQERVWTAQPLLEQIVADAIDGDTWAPVLDFGLDALIELRAELTPDLLARVAERRSAEGLILLSYVDDGTTDGVLLSMLDRERGYDWFAAANLLLERRPPGYVARLLTGLRLKVWVTISDDGETIGGGGMAGGIGCGISQSAPGMPPWPTYSLTSHARSGDRVLALGPTPVFYERRVSPAGCGPSRGGLFVDGPAGGDRLTYVAAVIGRTPDLEDNVHRGVRRTPGLQVATLEASVRAEVTRRHARFVRMLVADRFLTAEEAASLSVDVDVEVRDVADPDSRP